MAAGTDAVTDLQGLSSNWKKLQQQLKSDAKKSSKRSPSHEEELPNAKRQRLTTSSHYSNGSLNARKKSRMGSVWSGSKKDVNSGPLTSRALVTKKNEISTSDIAEGYDFSWKNKSATDLKKSSEHVNEGLSEAVEAGKYIAMDCEMVGVGPNPDKDSALARISIVNYHGQQLYDSFVQTKEAVTDYRTRVSGITPQLLRGARSLEAVQADVSSLLEGKILIGHALRNDLDALLLSHPKRDIRDTSRHSAYRQVAAGRTPGLKKLAKEFLGVDIQDGEHSSIEDARAAMLLFRRDKEGFEKEHLSKWGPERKLEKDKQNVKGSQNTKRKGRKKKAKR